MVLATAQFDQLSMKQQLLETISDKQHRCPLFRQYLTSTLALEPLDLYLALQEYEHDPTRGRAIAIRDLYLRPGSNSEVNLPALVRKSVQEGLSKDPLPANLFDVCEREVLELLCTECFHKFSRSQIYLDYVDAPDKDRYVDEVMSKDLVPRIPSLPPKRRRTSKVLPPRAGRPMLASSW
eukprot:CAMPEP_0177633796 /NCGR_PEP_ID=MMETSP0447-20121125/3031_1 /TAXON_ID=0 /ORGANISM="Stygamoeba regulata, Strain BSH-02190019" /LENGTH=179 /DNA_ID=CAMNT_0019135485 /DNA_START=42 /DNA_END=578 /DNA_ORIENTATION=+